MFADRHEAGRLLAARFENFKGRKNTIVLGLARGGVVVAYDFAKALSLPLNVVVPRKIGAPGNPELAIGAIMESGEGVFNESIIRMLGVSKNFIDREVEEEKARAHQRLTLYRQYAPLPDLQGQTVILVDDGIATGATMLAAIKAMRHAQAQRIIVAVPVSATDAYQLMEDAADEVVCLLNTSDFFGVSYFYDVFNQTEDEEVVRLLKEANKDMGKKTQTHSQQVESAIVHIPIEGGKLEGELKIPAGAKGIVLFAHGSGSSRFSPRNQFVASFLGQHQLATLLIDLLTAQEDVIDQRTREFRFDIGLLAERLTLVTDWLLVDPRTKDLPIGYFGSSTGAAAALIAAAKKGSAISSVVSRGGRPDLADEYLSRVKSPTLLIVGGHDLDVLSLNEEALAQITAEKKLEIVPGATHLFEEPGTLEKVADLASHWFLHHLTRK